MQSFMDLNLKNFLDLITVTFEVWGIKTSLGQFGPKSLIKP